MTTAERQLNALVIVAADGIPAVYSSFADFFTDYWMDFSWNDDMKTEVQSILDNQAFEAVQQAILEKYNFDVRHELITGRDFDPDAQ